MSMISNNVQLIGRLGQDPEMKIVGEKAHKRVNFNIAVQDPRRDANGERVDRTYWHRIVAWGSVAEIMTDRLSKGTLVKIMGKLVSYEYENNGEKRHMTQIEAQSFWDFTPTSQADSGSKNKSQTKKAS